MRAGLAAEVCAIDAIGPLDSYDAVVLGSAIHNMAWLPEAAAFLTRRAAELATRPVWLFSVSSVGETSSFFGPRVGRFMCRMRKESKEMTGFRQAIRPRDHRHFAGGIERSHYNRAGDLFLRAFGGSYGDHRDWADIDAWADSIAQELLATTEQARGPSPVQRGGERKACAPTPTARAAS
jgi:menaquinone-dependent protoporphyrinogen oxidase